jgi:hypothetical protein
MNEAAMNFEFYYDVELTFLGECITNTKYDRDEIGYGKTVIIVVEEGI